VATGSVATTSTAAAAAATTTITAAVAPAIAAAIAAATAEVRATAAAAAGAGQVGRTIRHGAIGIVALALETAAIRDVGETVGNIQLAATCDGMETYWRPLFKCARKNWRRPWWKVLYSSLICEISFSELMDFVIVSRLKPVAEWFFS
jgi:hypothetical protein